MLILRGESKMSSTNFRKIIISGKICKTGNKITVCADKEVEMKKEAVFMKRLFAAILCLCLLAGCGRTDSTGNTCRCCKNIKMEIIYGKDKDDSCGYRTGAAD